MKSLDPELKQTIKQDASEYSNDGVLVWHIIFHYIFTSKNVLTRTLLTTIRNMTNCGFKDNGLIFINNVHELLRFGAGIDSINNDEESISQLLKAF